MAVRLSCNGNDTSKNIRASELLGMQFSCGAYEELRGTLHLKPFAAFNCPNDYDQYYRPYEKLSSDDRVVYVTTFFTSEHGGDTSMQILCMTRNDTHTIVSTLNKCNAKDMARFCAFANVTPNSLAKNARHFFAVDLHFAHPRSDFRANFSNSYIACRDLSQKSGLVVYGLGIGAGYAYWLNRSFRHNAHRNYITLEDFFSKEYKCLNRRERAHLSLLLLSSPRFDRKSDSRLIKLFRKDASRINAELRLFNTCSLKQFCRWARISTARFASNIKAIQ
jgi:hypothetical protein